MPIRDLVHRYSNGPDLTVDWPLSNTACKIINIVEGLSKGQSSVGCCRMEIMLQTQVVLLIVRLSDIHDVPF